MNGALWLLPLFAVGYALWAFFRLRRMERNEPADGIVSEDTPCRQEIIGRSRFVLDLRHSRPQAAVESETEKSSSIFSIYDLTIYDLRLIILGAERLTFTIKL